MAKRSQSSSHAEELPSVVIVPTAWVERNLAKGLLKLSAEQFDQLEQNPNEMRLPSDLVLPLLTRTERKAPIEWIEPLDAVLWLSPLVGGDANAKSIIAESLRDGAIECTSVWMAEGADIGPVPDRRPIVSSDPTIPSSALWVTHVDRDGRPLMMGGMFWTYGDNWERDFRTWNWRDGLFALTRQSAIEQPATAPGSERGLLLPGRMVVSGIRFSRADIERIIARASTSIKSDENTRTPNNGGGGLDRGQKRGEGWDNWIAEVAAFVHEEGIPNPKITNGEFYGAIAKRLGDKVYPSFDSVAATISRLKIRLTELLRG